jgi:hypothetical protein
MVIGPVPTKVLATMFGPSVERVKLNEPPAFPVLQTTILPVTASGAGVGVTAPTAKLVLGTNAGAAAGDVGESEHAAKKASPNPALATSATLFICMSVSISSLVVIPRLPHGEKTRLSVASHDRDMERESPSTATSAGDRQRTGLYNSEHIKTA